MGIGFTIRSFFLGAFAACFLTTAASAQAPADSVSVATAPTAEEIEPDPAVRDLHWRHIQTEHFTIYYQEGLDRAAATAADAAESAYPHITDLYDYAPSERTTIVLRDHGDLANGFAAYFQNRIELWASNLDYEFRDTHDWLRDVTTHEFTHIVQLGQSQRLGPYVPQIYFQYFRLEPEHRSDVAEGLPNTIASYAVPMVLIPMWFAEGTAQYQSNAHREDYWDAHRDMIVRMGILEGKQLSYNEMGGFYDHDGQEAEMVYDHGFALVRHISETYGEDALRRITLEMKKPYIWSFDRGVRNAIGKSGEEVYDEWVRAARERYQQMIRERQARDYGEPLREQELPPQPQNGAPVAQVDPDSRAQMLRRQLIGPGPCTRFSENRRGFYNSDPAWSPDGERIAYISNHGEDYHITHVYVQEPGSDEPTVVPGSRRANSSVSWMPDGQSLVFARRQVDPDNNWYYNDLVYANLETGESRALTHGLRANYPAVSPDGRRIAFLRNAEGTVNLLVMNVDSLSLDSLEGPVDRARIRRVTDFDDGTQFFSPVWSPDGSRVAVSIARAGSRDLAIYRVPEQGPVEREFFLASPHEDRDPTWTPDGRYLVFSSAADGIFNLYRVEPATGRVERITNVIGGAFTPSVSAQGRIAYADYSAEGFAVRVMEAGWEPAAIEPGLFGRPEPVEHSFVDRSIPSEGVDRHVPALMTPAVFPRIGMYDGKVRLGAYGMTGDRWDDVLILGGFWMAPQNLDYDAFVLFEENHLLPFPIALDVLRMVRHTDGDTTYAGRLAIEGIDYGLNSIQLAFRPRIWNFRLNMHSMLQYFNARIDQTYDWGTSKSYYGYNYDYYYGASLGTTITYSALKPYATQDIGPQGWQVDLHLDHWWNWYFEDFDSNSSLLQEEYSTHHVNRVALDTKGYLAMPWHDEHTLGFEGEAMFMDSPVDSFFYEGIGGIIGLRGYTYYQLQGRHTAWGRALYRFPVPGLAHIDASLGPIYLDKIYFTAFAEAGRVWRDHDADSPGDPWVEGFKRDIGAELRADIFSFYVYPTRLSLAAVRALDPQPGTDRNKFYMTLLFGYF